MADNVLRGAHSYTLVKAGGSEKIVVRRGESINKLDTADQGYLATKSITPPAVDDSHPALGRIPLFQQALPADVKGEASIEQISTPAAPDQPYAGAAPVQTETVTVQVQAAPTPAADDADADADDTDDGAAAGGDDDSGGDEAPVAAAPKRRRKPTASKK